jgi:ankyrin repeat protein
MNKSVRIILTILSIGGFGGLNPLQSQSRTSPHERAVDIALLEAANAGRVSDIETLLETGANINAELPGDGSPLIAAAGRGRLDAVRVLLDRGADPNLQVPRDGNALIAAAKNGHTDVVALLLNRGARINDIVPLDETALIQACASGLLDVVRLLIDRGADVNLAAYSGDPYGEWRTPLIMARRGGHATVVSALLTAGARK